MLQAPLLDSQGVFKPKCSRESMEKKCAHLDKKSWSADPLSVYESTRADAQRKEP